MMKSISHSELWINTEYFIDAFRCVCSLSYLEEHNEICQFINSKDFIDGKLHRFYINLCALVDIHCDCSVSNSKRSAYKKMLKIMCPAFDWMFYERDKNAAHKDSDYIINSDISMSELIIKMKDAISTTKVVCSNVISNKIEYEYYAYDSLLFRYVNGITPDLEKGFNDSIYIKQQCTDKNSIVFKAISDVRQVRNLKPNDDYCVICTNGLIGQPYDMLEHRQDMCFKLNAWQQNCDVWVTIKNDEVEEMLQAFFNLFNLFRKELNNHENNTYSGHNC